MNHSPSLSTEAAQARGLKGWLAAHPAARLSLLLLAGWGGFILLFYAEEDWRGYRAWHHYQAAAKARGLELDWNAYIPPPVPDDENFFKAPNMQSWFVGRGSTPFDKSLSFQNFQSYLAGRESGVVAQITVVPGQAAVDARTADLVLNYDGSSVTVASAVDSPQTLSTQKPHDSQALYVDRNSTRQLEGLIRAAVESASAHSGSARLKSPLEFEISASGPRTIKPVRIAVRSDRMPGSEELQGFFPNINFGSGVGAVFCRAQVQPDGAGAFLVTLTPPPEINAADYVAWSDQFKPDFDALHEALQRPFARMEGDYEHPVNLPIPNFVCLRTTAQTLAQRAQSHLLLGASDKALGDMTLIHELSRIMEARPSRRPMTLVAAMINVAITGLYVNTIGDGLRLDAWTEPQLAALQGQLGEVDLMPYVHDAFQLEAAAHVPMVECSSSRQLADLFSGKSKSAPIWEKARDSTWLFLTFAPRGWVYRNMILASSLEERPLAAFDLPHRLVLPQEANRGVKVVEATFHHHSLFNILAAQLVPNFSRACQVLAKNQTLANEAFIACALERYRLASGHYPETLDALMPRFAEKIPVDLIGGGPLIYRREGDSFVLYSIGWNERDDGGKPGFSGNDNSTLARNDWVWPH